MIHLISNQITSFDSEEYVKSDLNICLEYLKDKKILGLDIETTHKYNKYFEIEGLDPHTSKIVMLQIGDIDNQFIIDTRNVDITSLVNIFEDETILFVGHNISFEYKHILKQYNVRLANVYDTMIMEQLLYNDGVKRGYSLNDLNNRYLDIVVDKSIRLAFLTIEERPFSTREIIYGADDIINPLRIREHQIKKANKDQKDLHNVFNLEMKFLLAKSEMEFTGILFDSEKWKEAYKKNITLFIEHLEKLDKYVIENFPDSPFIETQLDLFNAVTSCNIKWSSSKQVVKFYQFLEICPMAVSKTTKKLRPTVEAKEVRGLLVKDTLSDTIKAFIRLYLSAKELEQRCTTFGLKFLKNVNPITGRIHSHYKQILTTGRISSSNPKFVGAYTSDSV